MRLRPVHYAAAAALTVTACDSGIRDATFVGSASCAACHTTEAQMWQGSQHASAMQAARSGTVLAPFAGERVSVGGATTTFRREGTTYVANAPGPDGRSRDYAVRYTFGLWPLQQYLVEYGGGR